MPRKKKNTYKSKKDSVAGIPKKSAGKRTSREQDMYELGRTAASLKQQRTELEQTAAMNIMQMAMIADAKRQLNDLVADMERRTAQASAPTPMPQESVPLSPLPSAGVNPGGPMGQPGPALDMAAEMGGMPPEAMPPQGAGPMQGGPEPMPMQF